jgi:hypothetical protein
MFFLCKIRDEQREHTAMYQHTKDMFRGSRS